MGTFHDNRLGPRKRAPFRHIQFSVNPPGENVGFARTVERFPFVPSDESRLDQDCYEAYNIQVAGLVQRLRAIGSQRVVIGVSGGLDSTHALIVAAKAMDLLGRPRTNILAYTMPGFATGTQSKSQA
jgi:NAD+ synthase (glutamine-hydrolysing)